MDFWVDSWVEKLASIELARKPILIEFRAQDLPALPRHASDKPLGRYDVDEHADDVLALLDHLELPSATVVGWSFGGTTSRSRPNPTSRRGRTGPRSTSSAWTITTA